MNDDEKILNTAAFYAGYYRANPHRFAKDFLLLDLKLFQKILLYMMFVMDYFMYLASRGQGKSLLCSIFCTIRSVLYPGTKICVASGKRGQAQEIIDKIIEDLIPLSPYLRNEISRISRQALDYSITFKNGSIIKVVTAGESGRHNRANILIVDECRLVPKPVIDTILRKFLTAPRSPGYLSKPEYAHLRERNKELYFSSAYFKKHWLWNKVNTYCENLLDDTKKYFICALPYQLPIKENLLDREAVENEMSESDFDELSWSMEMGCEFWGESEDAFFTYESLTNSRLVQKAFYPSWVVDKVGMANLRAPIKKEGEIRLVCADIAVMPSKKNKNDATTIDILQLVPTKNGQYTRNLVYSVNIEGAHSGVQALEIRKLYEDFECDYIVMDANGVGTGPYDYLVSDLVDPDTGEIYPAFTCKNDDIMASRYQGAAKNPPKVIYSIKATAEFNSVCAQQLRDNINRKKTRLLVTEFDADMDFKRSKAFKALDEEQKAELLKPFVQTTLTINEIVNLEYEVVNNKIRISEKGKNRKDRYSALAYGNYVASELEREIVKKKNLQSSLQKKEFIFRKPKLRG